MMYRIRHQTTYTYGEPVSLCHNLLHLLPRGVPRQACRFSQLQVLPEPAAVSHFLDYFGNPASFFTIQEPHRELAITAFQETEVMPVALPGGQPSPPWEEILSQLRGLVDVYQFVFDSRYVQAGPELADYAAGSFTPGRPFAEALLDLAGRIHADFRYDPRATTVTSPLRQVLQQRAGVCQDFAHLAIGCLRSLGMAARYVSGYLRTQPPPGQTRLVGADASHAWLSAYCPSLGWLDVDPTNNQLIGEQHISLAWGRDYDDVSPVKGVILGGGTHTVSVGVDVTALDE